MYLEKAPISLALERAIEARLIAALALRRPILDVGCGDGLFASIALSERPDIGCDLSMKELSEARARSAYRSLVGGNAERLPFRDASFATVLSNSTLEHVRDVDLVLGEIARVLRPGGRVIITVPTPSYQRQLFWSRLFRLLRVSVAARLYEGLVNRVFRHRHIYDTQGWLSRLERHRLRVETATPYLSSRVVALDDLLYPVAAVGLIWKLATGSYVVPLFRRPIAALLSRVLLPLYAGDADGEGGYVLLIARSPDEVRE